MILNSIYNKLKPTFLSIECNGDCRDLRFLDESDHQGDCSAVLNAKYKRLKLAKVDKKTIDGVLGKRISPAYKFIDSFVSEEKGYCSGNSIIISGPPGIGKTVVSCSLIAEKGGLYVFAPNFSDFFLNSTENRKINKIHYLVVDDMGFEDLTAWMKGRLDTFIHVRSQNKLPTVFTTNLSLVDFKKRYSYSKRLESRFSDWIYGFCNVAGPDLRKLKNNNSLKH